MGIPWRVTLSARSLEQGGVELKRRDESERQVVPIDALLSVLRNSSN